jgi:hypothetical protein
MLSFFVLSTADSILNSWIPQSGQIFAQKRILRSLRLPTGKPGIMLKEEFVIRCTEELAT